MRVAICFVAFVIGCACATTCSDSSPCDTTITTCGNGYTLTCSSTGHCVCMGGNNQAHTCTAQSDCTSNHHSCNHGNSWHCVDGHCNCQGGHQGGHGGNGRK